MKKENGKTEKVKLIESGDLKGLEVIKPLTHFSFLGFDGYEVHAYRQLDNGHVHLTIGLCNNIMYDGDAARVYELNEKLNEIAYSRFTAEQMHKAHEEGWDSKLVKSLGLEWIHYDDELASIRSAFDSLAFGEEDPMYPDEVYNHCSDINDFFGFCNECERRRRGEIGIGMDDVSDKKPCDEHQQSICATIWAARHAGGFRNQCKIRWYDVKGDNRKKYLSALGRKTFAWKFKNDNKKEK